MYCKNTKYGTVQYCTIRFWTFGTMQNHTVPYDTVRYCPVLSGTVRTVPGTVTSGTVKKI